MLIVAEMSANHLGDLRRAHQIVDAAADAKADAIKFQTWTPDTMCVDPTYILKHGPWAGRRMMDLYREAWTPWDWHPELFDHARQRGLIPFSAAFDRGAVDFLEDLKVDRHKVASFELTDLPLIRYMASKGKPMILSTGMASNAEIVQAGEACAYLADKEAVITLLACTSAYPADAADANLAAWAMIEWTLCYKKCARGISDHTQGIGVACAAAALGASYIEKHLTLSRADGGPDAGFSMEPHEFAQLVTECRRAAAAVQAAPPGPKKGEDPSLRRSLWITQDVATGELLTLGVNVATARPALGAPCDTDLRLATAERAIKAGNPLRLEDIRRWR